MLGKESNETGHCKLVLYLKFTYKHFEFLLVNIIGTFNITRKTK